MSMSEEPLGDSEAIRDFNETRNMIDVQFNKPVTGTAIAEYDQTIRVSQLETLRAVKEKLGL